MMKSLDSIRLALCICAGLLGGVAGAAAPVHEFKLDNGMKLIVKEDRRAPVVVSQIWYKVGSSYEHDGITGISHVLEHMMFKGTQQHGPGEFSRIIAENGGDRLELREDVKLVGFRVVADRIEENRDAHGSLGARDGG